MMNSCKINDSTVDITGAALLVVDNTRLEMHTTAFSYNKAQIAAASLLIDGQSTVDIYNSKFVENLADHFGNILATQAGAKIHFYLCTFTQLDNGILFSTQGKDYNTILKFQKSVIYRKKLQKHF